MGISDWSSDVCSSDLKPGSAAAISVAGDDASYGDDPADADIVEQIRDLIDTRVRPAVANDGGDIIYRGFDKGKVFLQMQGACSGCPSSTATLKNRSEEHTSELQSLMRISYAVFCWKTKY